jgi:hypothetical protein
MTAAGRLAPVVVDDVGFERVDNLLAGEKGLDRASLDHRISVQQFGSPRHGVAVIAIPVEAIERHRDVGPRVRCGHGCRFSVGASGGREPARHRGECHEMTGAMGHWCVSPWAWNTATVHF